MIPKLLLQEIQLGTLRKKTLVTTVRFAKSTPVGDPVSQARIYESQAADELIFLDLDRSLEVKDDVFKIIRKVSEEVFIPLTVGGGIQSLETARRLFDCGADKIAINSAAFSRPALITEIAEIFGSQAIVMSIDYKVNEAAQKLEVFVENGKTPTGIGPIEWARECIARGAGEILLTCIDRDGTRSGLECSALIQLAEFCQIPIIISGGCGRASHFIEGFKAGADAIAAGTFFCFKDENPMQTRSQISNSGFKMRTNT